MNNETIAFLREKDNFLIINHRRPDGDAVGSAAALCLSLRGAGKTAHVWYNPQTTDKHKSYVSGLETETVPENATLVSVDMATENLLPMNGAQFAGKIQLAIDHHISNEQYANMTNVQPNCAACGEVLLPILRELGDITPEIANALYLALSTDTGCFQYSNVTADTLRAAAEMKGFGADTFAINKAMFGTKTIARLRLEAALTNSVEFYANGLAAVCVLTNALLDSLHATSDDTDNISGFPRDIEGVQIGVMLQELREGGTKISLRTGPDYNASEICASLGGGGHKAAAGATVTGDVAEAKAAILGAIADSGVVL